MSVFVSLEQNVSLSFFFSCFGTGYILFSVYILLGFGLTAGYELPHAFNFTFLPIIYLQVLIECQSEVWLAFARRCRLWVLLRG